MSRKLLLHYRRARQASRGEEAGKRKKPGLRNVAALALRRIGFGADLVAPLRPLGAKPSCSCQETRRLSLQQRRCIKSNSTRTHPRALLEGCYNAFDHELIRRARLGASFEVGPRFHPAPSTSAWTCIPLHSTTATPPDRSTACVMSTHRLAIMCLSCSCVCLIRRLLYLFPVTYTSKCEPTGGGLYCHQSTDRLKQQPLV